MANNFFLLTYLTVGSIGAPVPAPTVVSTQAGTYNGPYFSSYDPVFPTCSSEQDGEPKPFCADFDADGDKDCIIGTANNQAYYFENTGTSSSFDFSDTATEDNVLQASSDTSYLSPWCGDFDNDNDDYDCLLGCSSGKIYYYENKGTSTAPDFDRDTEIGDTTDLLDGLEAGTYVGPFCTDMTNDGVVDCFVGDPAINSFDEHDWIGSSALFGLGNLIGTLTLEPQNLTDY